jgi:potassium efflux system protein
LRRILEPSFYPLLNALIGFFLIDLLRDLLAPLPGLPRMLFMLEMAAVFGLVVWWLRPARLSKIQPEFASSIFFRAVGLGIRAALVIAPVAFLAEAAGMRLLAQLTGGTLLYANYTAVILYGFVRVLDGLVAYALHIRPLRLLGMVQRAGSTIHTRVVGAIRWATVIYWIYLLLQNLELADRAVADLWALLDRRVPIPELALTFGDLIAFAFTIWLTFMLSRFIRFALQEDVFPRAHLGKGQPYAISTLLHYAIVTIGFIVATLAVGFDMNRFSLVAGAFGVGIGFGLQSVVNNFVSGIILLTERPVEVGDTVAIDQIFGEVKRIGIRSSVVRTWQGAEVIVPNADLISQQVTNWTHSDRRRRIEIPVGVAYGSEPRLVLATLLETVGGVEHILTEPEPYALFMEFGDSSLDFELRAWTAEFDSYLSVRSALCLEIVSALRAAGITIPFPQRDLHIKSILESNADRPTSEAAAPGSGRSIPDPPTVDEPHE